jgi:hypothetical protein
MVMKRASSMLDVFAEMIAGLGGFFSPVALEVTAEEQAKREARRKARFMGDRSVIPLPEKKYYRDGHGSMRRRWPKRDKSVSARQARKRTKARRRELRRAAGGEGNA